MNATEPGLHHALSRDERVLPLIRFYETLSPASVGEIEALYAADAHFKDPFNDVRGHAAIRRIFEHMFTQVDEPRFEVHAAAVEGELAFLSWTMTFRRRGGGSGAAEGLPLQHIRGATEVRFNNAGLVRLHRDYWDAAEELYEKLPVLGALMRWLKRRLAA